MKNATLLFASLSLSLGVTALSHADVVFDQLGTNGSLVGSSDFTSQDFEAAYNQYDGIVIDDFTMATAGKLTRFSFASDYASPANATSFLVNIYSSAAGTTSASLSGDVASLKILPAAATIQSLLGGYLTTLDLSGADFTLPAGDYWIGVQSAINFGSFGQIYNRTSTVADKNGRFINPGGGFGLGANSQVNDPSVGGPAASAYRLETQPVPEPASMAALGFGALAMLRKRRKA